MNLNSQDVRPSLVLVHMDEHGRRPIVRPPTFWQRLFGREQAGPTLPMLMSGPLGSVLGSNAPLTADGQRYDREEVAELQSMLAELADTAVPRLSVSGQLPWYECPVLNASKSLGTAFTGLRAMWTHRRLVYLFYVAGLGESFLLWADAYQQDLIPDLEKHKYDIVTVVPHFGKMTAESAQTFRTYRAKFWNGEK